MRNDVVATFENIILDMVSIRPIPSLEVRRKNIEELNDEYVRRIGKSLPPFLISILTDWYLSEILGDKSVDKVSKTDCPILSNRQLKRRAVRESLMEGEIIDFLQQKCIVRQSSLRKTIRKEVM